MPDQPQLIYLEPDDEITSVVRRLRAAESGAVVIVAPGRSRATSSAVALRLLAQVAAEEARSLSLVADAPTRAVASEAGIAAFASVAEATSGKAVPDKAAASPRAPIHVVRGLPEGMAAAVAGTGPAPPTGRRSGAGDETMAVRVPPKGNAGGPGQSKRPRRLIPRWPWLAGLLIFAVVVSAALLPSATVSITPTTQAVGPKTYQLHLPVVGHHRDELSVTLPGTATGTRSDLVAASGTVTFFNWNTVAVEVPQGTQVSVGGTIAFTTTERIVVQRGKFGPPAKPGQRSVGVIAAAPGPAGNVAAGAIDTVDDPAVRTLLRGFADNPNSLVTNLEPTAGGLETPHTVIQQLDVDPVVAAIQADLASQLAAALAGQADRLFAGAPPTEVPQINVPTGLVGTEDQATFELTGTLAFDRPYVVTADLDAAARAALEGDPTAAPQGTAILEDSIVVEAGAATVNGEEMTIAVIVRAAAAAAIDKTAVRDRVAGMTVAEAKAALADQGQVDIKLWPDWLDRLPRIPFRISIETVAPANAASPSP
jgi:hypothetical protein